MVPVSYSNSFSVSALDATLNPISRIEKRKCALNGVEPSPRGAGLGVFGAGAHTHGAGPDTSGAGSKIWS